MPKEKKQNSPQINKAKAHKKKRQFFVLYYPEGESIGEEDVLSVTKELKENVRKKPEELRLDLIIHSWGGDL